MNNVIKSVNLFKYTVLSFQVENLQSANSLNGNLHDTSLAEIEKIYLKIIWTDEVTRIFCLLLTQRHCATFHCVHQSKQEHERGGEEGGRWERQEHIKGNCFCPSYVFISHFPRGSWVQNEAILPKLLAGFLLLPRQGSEQGVLHRHYRDRVGLCAWQRRHRFWAALCRRRVSKAVYTEFNFTALSALDTRTRLKTWCGHWNQSCWCQGIFLSDLQENFFFF